MTETPENGRTTPQAEPAATEEAPPTTEVRGKGAPHPEEKAAAVRMVRTLRAELGTEHGTVQRVASQLGHRV